MEARKRGLNRSYFLKEVNTEVAMPQARSATEVTESTLVPSFFPFGVLATKCIALYYSLLFLSFFKIGSPVAWDVLKLSV